MLKPQHLFAALLFFLFIYLFGYHSLVKYLRKDTIIIDTVEKKSDIPAPAITVAPHWKEGIDPFIDPNHTCWWMEDVYNCLEETSTYPISDIIINLSAFNWTARFEPHRSVLFTLSSATRKLSTKVSEDLLVLVKPETFPPLFPGDDDVTPHPDFLPSFYLHDPRYFAFSANPRLVTKDETFSLYSSLKLKHYFCK